MCAWELDDTQPAHQVAYRKPADKVGKTRFMQAIPSAVHAARAVCCFALQTTHQDAMASLQAETQQAREANDTLQQQLTAQQEAAAQQQEALETLQTTLADVQAQLGESASACKASTLALCSLLPSWCIAKQPSCTNFSGANFV